jgi:c-di-GMP-binding flagellar brake protein YcgR
MTYGGPERRKWPRIPTAARAKRLNSPTTNYLFVRDISIGGVGLTSSDPFEMGDLINLEIAISGVEKFIKVLGQVVRKIGNEPGAYGVKFLRFSPHSKSRLAKALSKFEDPSK